MRSLQYTGMWYVMLCLFNKPMASLLTRKKHTMKMTDLIHPQSFVDQLIGDLFFIFDLVSLDCLYNNHHYRISSGLKEVKNSASLKTLPKYKVC